MYTHTGESARMHAHTHILRHLEGVTISHSRLHHTSHILSLISVTGVIITY